MKKVVKKIAVVTAFSVVSSAFMSGCFLDHYFGTMPGTSNQNSSTTTHSSSDVFDPENEDVQKKAETIKKYIDSYYYFEQDYNLREESYFDGIMAGLDDPYSCYYTKEEYDEMMSEDSGEYVGVGAVVSKNMETGQVYVVKPVVGSPAERAGLLPNDIIIQVDDLVVESDMELTYVVDHIRGEEGSVAKVKIYREGEKDYLYFDIPREKLENTTCESEMLDNQIGYIQVSQFIENTGDQFKTQMDKLLNDGAKGIIIDLRDNPGGYLNVVIDMCDYILQDNIGGEGLILTTKDKNGTELEKYTCDDEHMISVPMVVLVNGNSASASEIFTGCMKDYDMATIVGTNTYGKGIVQSVIPLDDGSAIKITIAKYFTPAGNDIHKLGIAPDVEVELNEEVKNMVTIPHEDDNQLQKAIEILTR